MSNRDGHQSDELTKLEVESTRIRNRASYLNPALWLDRIGVQYEFDWRIWPGKFGLAITFFGVLEPFFTLASWIHYLISHWKDLTFWFWDVLFFWLRVTLNPITKNMLTFFTIFILLQFRSGLQIRRTISLGSEAKSIPIASNVVPRFLLFSAAKNAENKVKSSNEFLSELTETKETKNRSLLFLSWILLLMFFLLPSHRLGKKFETPDVALCLLIFFSTFFYFIIFTDEQFSEYRAKLMIRTIVHALILCITLVVLNYISLLGPIILPILKPI